MRCQLPVYSPTSGRLVVAGVRGALFGPRDRDNAVRARLSEKWGAQEALLVDSGTSALTLAMLACQRAKAGAVALPAFGCYDLATAADGARVAVVLYDVDPKTLGPAPGALDAAADAGATTLVIVHLYGVPIDLGPVTSLAQRRGIQVIEDAAQLAGGVGVTPVRGQLVVLSFGRGKGTTAGRGGALLATNPEGTAHLRTVTEKIQPSRRGFGEIAANAAQWMLGRPALYGIPSSLPFLKLGETVYHEPSAIRGISVAAQDMLGVSLSASPAEEAIRRRHAAVLLQELAGVPGVETIRPDDGAVPGYLRLPILLPPGEPPPVTLETAHGLGIFRGYPLSLAALPGFSQRCAKLADGYAGAERLVSGLWTLPTHSRLTAQDIGAIVSWVRDAGKIR